MARSKSTQSSAKGGVRTASKATTSKPASRAGTKATAKAGPKPNSRSNNKPVRPAVVVKVSKIPSKTAPKASPAKTQAKTPAKTTVTASPKSKSRTFAVAVASEIVEPLDELELDLEAEVETEAEDNAVEDSDDHAASLAASPVAPSRIAALSNPMPSSRAALRREPVAVTPIAPMMSTPRALPETLVERYELVKSRIAAAAKRSGRRAEDILLVAVTKYATPEQVRELLALGHRDLGENRVQHLLQQAAMVEEYQARLKTLPATRKAAADAAATLFDTVPGKPGIPDPAATSARWHMIGHLQRNKAKKIIELVRLTHSVDSLRVAEELQTLALKKDRVIDVLIQVNCSGEDQKFGCPIPATIPLAEQIGSMINVRVRGLMTMAAYSDNPEDARHTFARCRELFEELKGSGVVEGPVNILSMGMTGDFEVAIEEGANCVRIGSAIFGEHPVAASDEAESDEE